MHKSKLGGFIIDCHGEDLDDAAEFWSNALGYPLVPEHDPDASTYRSLDTGKEGLHIEVQQVDHASRVHLDIAADDIEAEVRRLETLGAKRVGNVSSWVVMEAPTGQRFCIVEAEKEDFDATANRW